MAGKPATNPRAETAMRNNTTILAIALVCLVAGAAGFWLYQERNRSGVEVSVGGRTLSLETR